ncbi:MAG: GPR1/FUN34/YaaH family transporter [Syntrophorhabdales bacterium]
MPWTLYTAVVWIVSMRVSSALAFTFMTLLIGFVLLVLVHFGYPSLTRLAGYGLIITALSAWYVMAHIIFTDVFGKNFPPVGKPWI